MNALYAIHAGSIFKKAGPVHETITLASLMDGGVPLRSDMTYRDSPAEVWEIFRGVIWNDDPLCMLFHDSAGRNNEFAWDEGAEFGSEVGRGKVGGGPRDSSLLRRSHFGDLQFLHGMGSHEGEMPSETKAKLLMWAEVMYKLATNQGISGGDKLKDVAVETGGYRLGKFFDGGTTPNGDATLHSLLTCDTEYKHVDVRRRALGSLLHMIQDSFAHGHTRRKLLNPEDRISTSGKTIECAFWSPTLRLPI